MRSVFARIPVGRDIGLLCLKDHQHRRAIVQLGAQRIGTCHMADQACGAAFGHFQFPGNVVGIQPAAVQMHQRTQRVLAYQCKSIGMAGGKVGWQVHVGSQASAMPQAVTAGLP